MLFAHILDKTICQRVGCKEAGINVPHLIITPPLGIQGPNLSIALSLVVCDRHKEEMRGMALLDIVPEGLWEIMNSQVYIEDVSEGEDSIRPENTRLVFNTQEEFIAIIERGDVSMH